MPKAEALARNLEALRRVRARLERAGIRSAASEAEAIVLAAGRLERLDFYAGNRRLTHAARRRADGLAARRARRTPLQHVLGHAWFYGLKFHANPGALVPRPETEVLVETALGRLDKMPRSARVLDVGTGTGCVAVCLTTERPDCTMTALDVSDIALRVARKNFKLHGLDRKIETVKSDLFHSRQLDGRRWDLIVSNPPYVPRAQIRKLEPEVRKDPRLALDGGPDGLEVIARLLCDAPDYLDSGGWLVLEAGKGQSRAVDRLAGRYGRWADGRWTKDLNGIERVLALRKT